MIPSRLVGLIETHADHLAAALAQRIRSNPKLAADYQRVPPAELRERVYEVYHNLSEWLLKKTEADIEARYTVIGARRAAQRVPLSTLLLGIAATKEQLWEFVKREGLVDRHVEVFQELELLQLVDQFFDRAMYYAARGYEKARTARAA
jgi:hypothetical protein